MRTDDFFKKNKAKSSKQLARGGEKREPYSKVLIVCEGEKTEPNYFEELKDYYALSSVNVKIDGSCGSDPVSVVEYGKKLYRKEKVSGDAFDKVYCVFDKDTHSNYDKAMNAIRTANPKDTYIAINSVPCFEYWLLLHFTFTTQPFRALPNNSACNQVLIQLTSNVEMVKYSKGQHGIFEKLINLLDQAKVNANLSLQTAEAVCTDNPTTRVHELITFLQQIKS